MRTILTALLVIMVFTAVRPSVKEVNAQTCGGTSSASYDAYSCKIDDFGAYFCDPFQRPISGACSWTSLNTCGALLRRPDYYCTATANGCILNDSPIQSTTGCSVSNLPTPIPTAAPGWGACGSCSTCGFSPSECVLSPTGSCVWDPARCQVQIPRPSCSIVFTPASMNINIGQSQDLTSTLTEANGTVTSTVDSFTPPGIVSSRLISTTNPNFYTTVRLIRVTGVTTGVTSFRSTSTVVGPGGSNSCTRTAAIGVNSPNAWWQAVNGDVLAGGNLTSLVPTSCILPACNPAFDRKPAPLVGIPGFPGLPIYSGASFDFSDSPSSVGISAEGTNWLANSQLSPKLSLYNYAYFVKQIPPNVTLNPITLNQLTQANLTSGSSSRGGYIWYKTKGNTAINGNIQIAGNTKVILLVEEGDLNINGTIDVQTTGQGFFMAIVQGNIIINPSVSSQTPDLEGVFLADGEFGTGTTGTRNDQQLTILGSVAAHEGITLQRNLGSLNSTTPAEVFEYSPELLQAYPKELGRRRLVWEEVAP